MSMTAGKPILTYGKDPKNSQEIAEFLAPKYDGKPHYNFFVYQKLTCLKSFMYAY